MPKTVATTLAEFTEGLLGAPLPIGLRAWDGSFAGPPDAPVLVLRSVRALRRLLYAPGELGMARAYVTGDLDVEGDLTEGLRRVWALANAGQRRSAALRPAEYPRAAALAVRLGALGPPPAPPPEEARMSGVLHSVRRDSAAIAHHYDLGNAFYQLLLDESMAYSCAYWEDGNDSDLPRAQHDKLELICTKLGLRPGMRLLDVGCGWGSLLIHAARHHGVHAVGVTLSAHQCQQVRARVHALGLDERVEVRRTDYRELGGETFDAVASVEMGEHVGEENYQAFAATLLRALSTGGRLLLQQMSRDGTAPGGGAFVERYIAPDMTMRPLVGTLAQLRKAGFGIRDVQQLRAHYVRTVRAWAGTLEQRWDEAVSLLGEQGARVWWLYLAGGALAFEQNRMGVDQILALRRS